MVSFVVSASAAFNTGATITTSTPFSISTARKCPARAALEQFLDRCARMGIRVILSGLQEQPREVLAQTGVLEHPVIAAVASGFDEALARARVLVTETA